MSLRNRTAERRGRQNACAWQTWRACYVCVLRWSSLKLMFSGLLQKDVFKGGWSTAEKLFKQNYCHACHTKFAVFFPLPSCCVSSLLKKTERRIGMSHVLFIATVTSLVKHTSHSCPTESASFLSRLRDEKKRRSLGMGGGGRGVDSHIVSLSVRQTSLYWTLSGVFNWELSVFRCHPTAGKKALLCSSLLNEP